MARLSARAVRCARGGPRVRRSAVWPETYRHAVRVRADGGGARPADAREAAGRRAPDGGRSPHRGGRRRAEAGRPRDDLRRRAARRHGGARGAAHHRRARVPRRGAGKGRGAGRRALPAACRRAEDRRRARAGPDVGNRARGAGGPLRDGGAGARLARLHGRRPGHSPGAAARGDARGARAGGGHSGRGAGVKALPIVGERGAGSGSHRSKSEGRFGTEGTAPRSLLAEGVVRGAVLADVPALEALQAPYVATGDLLPRNNYDLCRPIKEWGVVAEPGDGSIVGCGALEIYSGELAEVAGLAVRRDRQGGGLGRALLEALLPQARDHGLVQVFALTRKPDFFLRLGFQPAEKEQFPEKVWADCARCPRQNCCDEIAVALRL